jgi:hypothetical protein
MIRSPIGCAKVPVPGRSSLESAIRFVVTMRPGCWLRVGWRRLPARLYQYQQKYQYQQ